MRHPLAPRTTRALAVALSYLCAFATLPTVAPALTPTQTTPSFPALAHQLSFTANDLAYDPGRQIIYASVPSRAGANGNSVMPLDPAAETFGAPVFVGSEPNKLARSDDGQFLYVGLDGAGAVRRVDLATHRPLGVLIAEDAFVETPETFTITLKDPSGVALDPTLSTITVTILDNDTTTTTVNPDDVGLDGQPDPTFSGYLFWLDKLNRFGDFRSAEMVKAFLVSLEYQQRFGPTTFDFRK